VIGDDVPNEQTIECIDLLDAREPIRQGDVLEWLSDSEDLWRRHAIVVTADCDIVHQKHAGALATVPVLRYDEYLASFALPLKLRAAETQIREKARSQLRAMQAKYRTDQPGPLSDAAIDGWIAHAGADAILRTLRASDDKTAEEVRTLVRWLQALPDVEQSVDLGAQLAALTTAKVIGGSTKDEASLRATLARENVDRLKNLPGDALFLHSLGGLLTDGYVAYLRRVDNVHETAVALKFNELRDAGKVARRISRLSSPYVFRLTQQLGQVFSAIGLPGSYEVSRGRFLVDQVETLKDRA
jgi:hypothetical protein